MGAHVEAACTRTRERRCKHYYSLSIQASQATQAAAQHTCCAASVVACLAWIVEFCNSGPGPIGPLWPQPQRLLWPRPGAQGSKPRNLNSRSNLANKGPGQRGRFQFTLNWKAAFPANIWPLVGPLADWPLLACIWPSSRVRPIEQS